MKNLAYFSLAALLLTGACKKKESDPANENLGNMSGNVIQYNQYGEKLSTDLNRVLISLDNDNVIAISDEAGNYILKDVKPGIYTITYSKEGCKKNQKRQINFPGNGTLELGEIYMVEDPTFTFSSATASIDHSDTSPAGLFDVKMNLNLKLNPVNKPVQAAFIFNDNENFDNINPNLFVNPVRITIPANTSDFTPPSFSTHMHNTSDLYVKIYTYSGTYAPILKNEDNTYTYFGYGSSLPAIKLN